MKINFLVKRQNGRQVHEVTTEDKLENKITEKNININFQNEKIKQAINVHRQKLGYQTKTFELIHLYR